MSETTQRLLEAAGEVFAEKGFRSATIREICDRAKTNVAAVNYHFHDKEGLYVRVMEYWTRAGEENFPTDLGLGPNPTAEDRLRAFVRSFLFRILDKGQPAWLSRLMAREMAEPTVALDRVIDDVYRPLMERLTEIVRSLLGPAVTLEQVRLCGRSIVGQCLHYYHARPVIEKMTPDFKYESADLERVAEHITQFSLAALRQLS